LKGVRRNGDFDARPFFIVADVCRILLLKIFFI